MEEPCVVVFPEHVCRTRPEKEVETMHHKMLLFTTLMFLFITAPAFSPASRAEAAREPSVKGGEPASHFQKADELFLKKDLKTAASEIRKGARFLTRKAKGATKDSKEAINASVQELEKLAKDVETGGVTSRSSSRIPSQDHTMPYPITNTGGLLNPGPRKRQERPAKPLRMRRNTWSRLQSGPAASWRQARQIP